jgi:hypothetical protein
VEVVSRSWNLACVVATAATQMIANAIQMNVIQMIVVQNED